MALLTPASSRRFTAWTHPATGAASHVLTTRIAPVQQTFHHTHPTFTTTVRDRVDVALTEIASLLPTSP